MRLDTDWFDYVNVGDGKRDAATTQLKDHRTHLRNTADRIIWCMEPTAVAGDNDYESPHA